MILQERSSVLTQLAVGRIIQFVNTTMVTNAAVLNNLVGILTALMGAIVMFLVIILRSGFQVTPYLAFVNKSFLSKHE